MWAAQAPVIVEKSSLQMHAALVALAFATVCSALSEKTRLVHESFIGDVFFDISSSDINNELPDLSGMERPEKRSVVYEYRKNIAQATQAPLIARLSARALSFRSFWAKNTVCVYGIHGDVIGAILDECGDSSCGVTAVHEREFYLRDGLSNDSHSEAHVATKPLSHEIQPNIIAVKAPEAWEQGNNGTGVVVATLDGGVRYTHKALVDGYRGTLDASKQSFDHDYNW